MNDMPRFTLDQALAVLADADNDLMDDTDDPYFITIRPTGRTPDGTQTATITLTPCGGHVVDDAETFNVTIKRADRRTT